MADMTGAEKRAEGVTKVKYAFIEGVYLVGLSTIKQLLVEVTRFFMFNS